MSYLQLLSYILLVESFASRYGTNEEENFPIMSLIFCKENEINWRVPSTLGRYVLSSNEPLVETVNGPVKCVDSESLDNIWSSSNIGPAKARKKSNRHGPKPSAVRLDKNGTSGSSNKRTLIVERNSSLETF